MTLGFNTSISGLIAAQRGINVTQMNVSNMNTDGYVRQKLDLVENNSSSGAGVDQRVGSGVLTQDIQRITDLILQNNYNDQNSAVGYSQEIQDKLTDIQTVMGSDSTTNLNSMMTDFFNAWQELSKFPEESSYRQALVGVTNTLTKKLNDMGQKLGQAEQDTIDNTQIQVDDINSKLNSLAEINKKINASGNNVPNSLLDQRDRVIQDLSSYMKIDVSYESNNPQAVTIRSGGVYLLDNEKTYDIQLNNSSNQGYYLSNGSAKIDISSGKLKADLDVVDKYLKGYTDQLNTITTDLMNQVNSIHSAGFSINGDTGINFFVGTDSKDIQINPVLSADTSQIATTSVNGVEGNTDIASNISNVLTQPISSGVSFQNFVNSFSTGMAQDLNNATNQTTVQNQVLSGLGERKSSVQGVNLEEEMTNLMNYQKYFQANAKSIKVVSDTLDTMLGIIQ